MLHRPRIIPVLSIDGKRLVKTIRFQNPRYLGDPMNSLRIFNNKGVDELCILDIRATIDNREPDFDYLREIASEAFMPLSYGGGVYTIEHVKKLLYMGYEKVVFNSSFFTSPELISESVKYAGSQSVVLSLDVKKDAFGRYSIYSHSGTVKEKNSIEKILEQAINLGVGEIILNSINNDGMMLGYDIGILKNVVNLSAVPVVICGGAGNLDHFIEALKSGAHAVSAGSMFVYYGKQKGVLINFPSDKDLREAGIFHE